MKPILQVAALLASVVLLLGCSGGRGDKHGEPLDAVGQAAPTLAASVQPLNILIFGGSAGIGLQTTQLALARGHQVTSITRRPERMPLSQAKLHNLKGDITKPETYADLIAEQDVIISAIGLGPTGEEVTVYSEGMAAVLATMQVEGKRRVITVTGIGAGDSKGHGGFFYDRILNPLLLETDYADKTRQEVLLRASDSDWTIVRPGFLTDDAAQAAYRVIQDMTGVT